MQKHLIEIAKQKMTESTDRVHDLSHVKRVVRFTKLITTDLKTNIEHKEILILAAWWHDAGRTINKNTSLVWMSFFDDIVSACMLWQSAWRNKRFNKAVWLAGRIILCKSLGTGTFFTKIFLKKKSRHLVDILEDADALDAFHIERFEQVRPLVEQSTKYYYAYKLVIKWWLAQAHTYLNTEAARKYIKELFQKLIAWVTSAHIKNWHIELFGIQWVKKNLAKLNKTLDEITLLNLQTHTK